MLDQNLHAEQSVLGALMICPNAWGKVEFLLRADMFTCREHALIFSAIKALKRNASAEIDVLTVTDQLEREGHADEVGGLHFVATITKDTPSAANVAAYASMVVACHKRGKLAQAIKRFEHGGLDTNGLANLKDAIAEFESGNHLASVEWSDLVQSTEALISENIQARIEGRHSGIPYGLHTLDALTGGIRKGITIIAGRPGTGKTAFINQIILSMAYAGRKVCVHSFEMEAQMLCMRAMAHNAQVSFGGLDRGFEMANHSRVLRADPSFKDLPIRLSDGITRLNDVLAQSQMWVEQNVCDVLVIDHIGLIQDDRYPKEYDRVSEAVKALMAFAKRNKVAVIVACQLSRTSTKERRRPNNSDLRGSGQIEECANQIVFLYDEAADSHEKTHGVPNATKLIDIGVTKNRNGQTGWTPEKFEFDGDKQTFFELAVPTKQENEYADAANPW